MQSQSEKTLHNYSFLCNSIQEKDMNYEEAKNDPRWIEAMSKELSGLEENYT